MDAASLLDIAATWSFWDRPVPASVPRRLELPPAPTPRVCVVVQGVRRAGKSTLMQQMIGRWNLDPGRCAFLHLEDPRLARALRWETLEAFVQAFRAQHAPDVPLTFFLDEIQHVEGWTPWLRSRLDQGLPECFVISGSNGALLSGELSTSLTGRHRRVTVYPFDLAEVQSFDPSVGLEQWLHRGGFPAAWHQEDPEGLLRQYFEDIVERDIRERVAARSARPVRQVVQMAFESAGAELSLRRVAGACGVAVETAHLYLEAAEQAYLIVSLPWFAWSTRQQAHRARKYYPVDPALARVTVLQQWSNRGKWLEAATVRAALGNGLDVAWWKSGAGEVDLVLRDGPRIQPVQVTWSGPEPRHERALASFYESWPQAEEARWVTAETFLAFADNPREGWT
jgi:predicted AAA+ superfamily ATPase